MENRLKAELISKIESFRMPSYNEIPDVGLFLEQTTKYISGIIAPLDGITITSSMISNYVKKKLIESPVKKQYSREQIAYLLFIAIAKSVTSLENIQFIITLQKKKYDSLTAYEYFCREFEAILKLAFGIEEKHKDSGTDSSVPKDLLRNTIIAVAHKVYLEKYLLLANNINKDVKK